MPDDDKPIEENIIRMSPRPKKKGFKPILVELGRILRTEPELVEGKMFRHDRFSGETMLVERVPRPGVEPPAEVFKPRPTREVDIDHLCEWFEANGAKGKVAVTTVERAVRAEGHRNAYSSARDALDRLPVWDNVYRLDSFWERFCGAVVAEEGMSEEEIWSRSRYLTSTARCFFIGMVARILKPGCKLDTMVILEGPQGSLKSTLLRVLAFENDDWFSDSMVIDLKNKDARAHLAGKLIIELPELTQFGGSKVEVLKAFLSAQDDKFRPAYGRGEVKHERQCVFVGTTNASDYLADVTGNRRFWPIKCGQIDLAKAKELRDQLFAEALVAWRAGEQWWLPADVEIIAASEQSARLTSDPWEPRAAMLVETKLLDAAGQGELWAVVTATEVLQVCAGDIQHWDTPKLMRAARVLAKLGGIRIWVTGSDKKRGKAYRFDVPRGGASGAGVAGSRY